MIFCTNKRLVRTCVERERVPDARTARRTLHFSNFVQFLSYHFRDQRMRILSPSSSSSEQIYIYIYIH